MHLKVLACDLDGTLAENGQVSAATWEALERARAAGVVVLLVTGRVLETFAPEGPYADMFAAIVAEDGAVVYFPAQDRVVLPFGHLAPELLDAMSAQGIPFDRGLAIAATHVPHDEPILAILRSRGGGATVEYNRGAVMVLPPGATKGTGLRYALDELGLSPHNTLVCGDAENDRSLFEIGELAVAVANAAPDIQALADTVLPEPDGAGIRGLIDTLLAGRLPAYRLRPQRQLSISPQTDGQGNLDPFALLNGNLGIFGRSGGGKSWLAGLLAEELLRHQYQVCIIDPEGDYRGLRSFPRTLLLGGPGVTLPPVADIITLLEYAALSLVLDLSAYPVAERATFVLDLLREFWCLRARRGRPHWLLIDEIQSFCPRSGGEINAMLQEVMTVGGIGVVSYRPSLVDPRIMAALDHWLLTRLSLPSEIEAVQPFLNGRHGCGCLLDQLPTLTRGQACMCLAAGPTWQAPAATILTLRASARVVPHIRHLNKYLRAALPASKRFYFCAADGTCLGRSAASLWEFRELLAHVDLDSLIYHTRRGDFEHWVRDVLRDDELARRLRKIAHRTSYDPQLRQALVLNVSSRYEELEQLV